MEKNKRILKCQVEIKQVQKEKGQKQGEDWDFVQDIQHPDIPKEGVEEEGEEAGEEDKIILNKKANI